MKSRTSFCNTTILRMDITRFAPVWVLYTIGMLLFQLMFISQCKTDFDRAWQMQYMIHTMVPVNGLYALLVGLTLFGDLLNPRLCNSIHAMPLTRDDFFVTHAVAGFGFSVIPNALVILASMPLLGKAMPMAMYLFVMAVGSYILYFGTALLAIQLAGNRIAAVLIYGIMHFTALLAVWFVHYLYEPLMYGLDLPIRETILKLCPTVSLMQAKLVEIVDKKSLTMEHSLELAAIRRAEGWAELGIWVLVGMVALAAAQILYRRRKLEMAGDLLAYKKMEPLFLPLFTLTVTGFFHVVSMAILNGTGAYVFLTTGVIVGWFAAKMLLQRRVAVFRWRDILPIGMILVLGAVSIVLCVQDAAGVVHSVPEAGDISYAKVEEYYSDDTATLREPEEIQRLIQLHRTAVENFDALPLSSRLNTNMGDPKEYNTDGFTKVTITYYLKNGDTMVRRYHVAVDSEDGAFVRKLMSQPETLLGVDVKTVEELDALVSNVHLYYRWSDGNLNQEDRRSFFEAMLADCKAGNLYRSWQFRRYDYSINAGFELTIRVPEGMDLGWRGDHRNITVFTSNTHLVQWLIDHDYVTQEEVDEMIAKQEADKAEWAEQFA